MRPLVLGVVLTFVIMFVTPFPIYASLSVPLGLQPPTVGSPAQFFLSVVVFKIGVAIGFVWLFHLARDRWVGGWKRYALVWWVMFAFMEAGQAILPEYTILDAAGGVVAEAIYFPLSALVVARLLGLGTADAVA